MNKKLKLINILNICAVVLLLLVPVIIAIFNDFKMGFYLNINIFIIISAVLTLIFVILKFAVVPGYDYNSYILFLPIAIAILSGICYYLCKSLEMFDTLYLMYYGILIGGIILICVGSKFFDRYFKKKLQNKPNFAPGGRK